MKLDTNIKDAICTGIAMHTGLRKLGQSKLTSQLWHVVNDLPDKLWLNFAKEVYDKISVYDDLSYENLINAVKTSIVVFESDLRPRSFEFLDIITKFSHDDWVAMVGFLGA